MVLYMSNGIVVLTTNTGELAYNVYLPYTTQDTCKII